MNVIIIPPDSRMSIDGVFKTVALDLPHVNCARLEGDAGSIEHRKHEGEWKAPRALSKEDFVAEFREELIAYHNALTDEELAAQRRQAEEENPAQAAMDAPQITIEHILAFLEMAADAQRARHITPGSTMGAVYAEKAAEAIAVDAMGRDAANALPGNGSDMFPLLAASVGIEGETLFDVAELIGSRAEETVTALAAIERVRLQAKKAIKESASIEEAKAIYEAIQWP